MSGMVCAVAFQTNGRLYYYDPGDVAPRIGDHVLVPTQTGPEVAQCVWAAEWVGDEFGELPRLLGRAGDDDLQRHERSTALRAQARVAARRLIREEQLPMKVVGVDWIASEHRFVIYFGAPHRVDFRVLVRRLSAELTARVELRQVGARDEAKLLGGVGSCGRELCCSTFLKSFEPVSVRMARDQELPANPLRISGACGRLMCCLKYEHPLYEQFRAETPAVGTTVSTPDGDGRVIAHRVPADEVVVRLSESGEVCACSRASVCSSRKAYEQRGSVR